MQRQRTFLERTMHKNCSAHARLNNEIQTDSQVVVVEQMKKKPSMSHRIRPHNYEPIKGSAIHTAARLTI